MSSRRVFTRIRKITYRAIAARRMSSSSISQIRDNQSQSTLNLFIASISFETTLFSSQMNRLMIEVETEKTTQLATRRETKQIAQLKKRLRVLKRNRLFIEIFDNDSNDDRRFFLNNDNEFVFLSLIKMFLVVNRKHFQNIWREIFLLTPRNSLGKTQPTSLWDGLGRVFEAGFDLFNSPHEFRGEASFLWVKLKSKTSRIWLNKRDNKREDSKWSWDEKLIQRSLQIHKIIFENVTHLLLLLLHFTYDLIEQSIARCWISLFSKFALYLLHFVDDFIELIARLFKLCAQSTFFMNSRSTSSNNWQHDYSNSVHNQHFSWIRALLITLR